MYAKFKHLRRRSKVVAALCVVVALAAAGSALAYYAGAGASAATNAKAGASPVAVSVSVDATAAQAIYPGDPAASLPVTVSAIAHPSHVSTVHLTLGTLPAGCSPSWFTLTDPSSGFGSGANVTPGNPLVVSGSITFTESGTDQSACSLANLPITATAA